MPLLELPTEIHIQVLSTLSLADMRVMMLVSAGWHHLIKTFLSRKLHIGLLPYVDDPPAFRDTMRQTHSVISGSFALDFALHGTTRPPFPVSDLDVYCGVANAITVIEYLRRKESYLAVPLAFLPCVHWIDDYDGGIATVVRMLHPRGSKIDIICSSRISALHPLSYFWSTAVMSFLAADGFCSAYHSLTERGISCINPSREVTPRVKRCIKKYETRGFIIDDFGVNQTAPHATHVLDTDDACAKPPQNNDNYQWNCPHVTRRFSDAGSLHLSFGMQLGATSSSLPFPFEEPEWIMGGKKCAGCERISGGGVLPYAPHF